MTTEYEKAMDAQPVAWVAADTLNSPHPVCVSSLAYVSQLDKDRGREYVPLYAAPVAAQGEDDARDAARYRWLKKSAFCNVWARGDGLALVAPRTPVADVDSKIDAAIDQARGKGVQGA